MGRKGAGHAGRLAGVHLMIYVDDCDAVFKRAIAAGGKEMQPLKDQFYGDRSGTLTDPFGHSWTIATHKEDVSPEEIQRRANEMMKQMRRLVGCDRCDGRATVRADMVRQVRLRCSRCECDRCVACSAPSPCSGPCSSGPFSPSVRR